MNISIIPPISKACFPLPGSYLTYIIQGKRKLESSQAEHLSRGSHWCQIDLENLGSNTNEHFLKITVAHYQVKGHFQYKLSYYVAPKSKTLSWLATGKA